MTAAISCRFFVEFYAEIQVQVEYTRMPIQEKTWY